MLLVNLYGAPGSGKSTGAAYIFSKLKMMGVKVELVTEFAKEKTWEGSREAFTNQAYVFGEQYHRITRCEDKVDVIITDSPLITVLLYNKNKRLGEKFIDFVVDVAKGYDTLDYHLIRKEKYDMAGRWETEEESEEIVGRIRTMLGKDMFGVCPVEMAACQESYDVIVGQILNKINKISKK